MKTEQEQIEQIEKVLKDSVADYKHLKKKGVCYCYAETLIDKGYGNVSEYKAEIERLKEETSNIRKDTAEEFATRICEMLWNLGIDKDGNRFSYGDLASENVLYVAKQFGVDIDDRLCKKNDIATSHINKLVEQDVEIKKLKQQVRQAKIDVLNELKTRHDYAIKNMGYPWDISQQIDKLIKEVEDETR